MRIAKGVEILELKGNQGYIYPTLIWNDDETILIDAGYPGQVEEIKLAMNKAGVPLEKLNAILITHQDWDHIGSLKEISKDYKIEIIAHQEEIPYIEGKRPLIKMTRLLKMFESLPEIKRKEEEAKFIESLKSNVQQAVKDNELLPYCGGITIIHTPGHTPGHICLYLNECKALIAGDALNIVDGQLVGANPIHTADMELAKESIRKLTDYDIDKVICYHGGVYEENVNKRLFELAAY